MVVFRRENPLVARVMHRHHRGAPAEKGIVIVQRFPVRRDESRLPVVTVDDVRGEAEVAQGPHHSVAEKDETLGVVRIGGMAVVVQPVAPEIPIVFDKIHRDSGNVARFEDGRPFLALSKGYAEGAADHLQAEALPVDDVVARHEYAHVVAAPRQRRGEGVRDIGEPAGLREGIGLGCRDRDFHAGSTRGGW